MIIISYTCIHKILALCPEHPRRDQNPKIYTLKGDDKHPRLFHMGVPQPPPPPLPPAGLTSVKRSLLQISVPALQSRSLKIVCTVGSC